MVKPLHDWIIVDIVGSEERTTGSGIIVPNAEGNGLKGTARAVGAACKHVKPGDTIIFKNFKPVELPEEDLAFVPEGNVVAVYGK